MCSACAMKIEKQLEISQGVLSANVDFTNLLVTGQFDPEITSKTYLIQRIEILGYCVVSFE